MTTRERIERDFTREFKARNASAVSTLRMLRAAIKNLEIDKMKTLEEQEVVDVVGREVKKLRDGLESFKAGGREDLAAGVAAEIALIEIYLPAQLDDAALNDAVQKTAAAMGPLTEKDFGRLMKEVMKATAGKADGQKVSAAVKAALAPKP
jgi:uncharacterized protein YqeY